MQGKGCDFCRDLRNIQPASYVDGGDDEFQEWIKKCRECKAFIIMGKEFFTATHECPVCGKIFTDGDYDSYC